VSKKSESLKHIFTDPGSNGENVESAHGQKMQMKFTQELWAKLEGICPGVTRV